MHTISDTGKQEAINQSVRKTPETLIIPFATEIPPTAYTVIVQINETNLSHLILSILKSHVSSNRRISQGQSYVHRE